MIESFPSFKEELDGILFKEVKNIVKTRENLENILLSTKVIFEEKDDLLEFFDMLLKFGFRDQAMSYFEDIIAQNSDYELIDRFNALLK